MKIFSPSLSASSRPDLFCKTAVSQETTCGRVSLQKIAEFRSVTLLFTSTLPRVFSCEFITENPRTAASVLSLVKLLFSTKSKFSPIFSKAFCTFCNYQKPLTSFHYFIIENWKSLYILCEYFYFLQT